MKVDLANRTPDLLQSIYVSAKNCTSAKSPQAIRAEVKAGTITREAMLKTVRGAFKSGHLSVAEHCYFTFDIDEVSRALTHQIVRHRHSSHSQESQRYVAEKEQFNYVTPQSIKDKNFQGSYDYLMFLIQEQYTVMVNSGVPVEDARYVLPNACHTADVMSLNLRELMHIAGLRLCGKAQWEARDLVEEMCRQVIEVEPWLQEFLHPKCVIDGKCTEMKSCGMYEN